MKPKKIVFFNQFHNGDCFVGKGYVREMMRQLPDVEFQYAHNNHLDIIKDIPMEMIGLNNIPPLERMTRVAESPDKSVVFVNTWVGCWQGVKFPFGEHINYQRLHTIWSEYFKYFNLEFNDDPNYYLPDTDFTKFDTSAADVWYRKHGTKSTIMICNGPANSGQSQVGDLSACITALAGALPTVNILVTHKLNIVKPNVFYTDDIFAGLENDINQLVYLLKVCDIVVGKNSGPFTFSQTKTNLMDEDLTFLNLSLLATDCPFGGGMYKARCVHTAETNDLRIAKLIETLYNNPAYRGTEIV